MENLLKVNVSDLNHHLSNYNSKISDDSFLDLKKDIILNDSQEEVTHKKTDYFKNVSSHTPKNVKKNLDKDDFLKIMVTQMKNQDPTNPFKSEQMASEIAQFTSVEQLQNVNQNLSKIFLGHQLSDRMLMTNLIGKHITIDRDYFYHKEGDSTLLQANLEQDAAHVKVLVLNAEGQCIFKTDLQDQKKGLMKFLWDGHQQDTSLASSGKFFLKIEAKDLKGNVIKTQSKVELQVNGLSFEGGQPILLAGNHYFQDKIGFDQILKVQSEKSKNE